MKLDIRQLLFFTCAVWTLCVVGCASKGATRLCDGFQSYETAQDVRNALRRAGMAGRWQEESKGTAHSDPRPAYQFLTMSGPFSLSGIDGRLKLIFYNDRLMAAEFSTGNGREYLAALKEQRNKVPEDARREIRVDRRTKFRYDIDGDGAFRFSWTDPKLEAEWLKWVQDNG